ncbi:class I adenylate-forming enzyme family protein [Quisquiliibacterium transsilvanicum]|uniref:Acyl-CoA synthetase (AMP-forming)/AMP-acid ligase II n=1 Tax=Quisquiliibacterium transsilvanicum TaxID=1549638 RepID=A0A7W8M7X9_9BURK|nr:AMP-binding protein [Quisquiliibacterium transsilvanicum]MBB5271243.1 acyl-CoA synthetase (AMP-forming)/AMP-acid ligase II [Quisquiliibacterium transsilvanicum]
MRIIDFFDRGALIARNRACTHDLETGLERTYAQVQRATHQIANGLLRLGAVPERTKVAVYSPNCGRALESILGVLRSAAIWAPVNARNSTQDIAYLLDNNDVEILLYHSDYADRIEELRAACPKLRAFVPIDADAPDAQQSVDRWLAAAFVPAPEATERPDAPMAVFGSGGTTGRPKGVVHSHRTWECLAMNVNVSMPPKAGEPVHLVVAPMTHAAGAMTLPLLAVGATHVLMKAFDSKAVLDAIETHRVTHLFLPPTAVYMLLADPGVRSRDYSSLEYFVYAAAPMSVEKIRQSIEVFGPVMVQTYGQTEAGALIGTFFSAQAHVHALRERPGRLASCGQATPLTKVKIVDDEGRALPPGERGEIAIGGDFQMIGYYKNDAATAEVRRDGWILTGDVGQMDEDGFVYIVDRKREMIITGGFNVYPSEIEQAIFSHPAVQDCAVIGVPDEKWGEAVKAIVQLKPGAAATEAEIIDACKQRLGSVMAPKSVDFWPELPKSAVGKVVRRTVREQFWAGRERAIV